MKSEEELLLEDIDEQAKLVGKLTPRDYAKLRGIQPQLVYYYIRQGKIQDDRCACGRRVLDVKQADEFLQAQADKKRQRSGQPVLRPDAAPDEGSGTAMPELPQVDPVVAPDD